MLNEFFSDVVQVVADHGGLVNKFEGDAALCIFGAPAELQDAATACLCAAREMTRRMQQLPEPLAAGHRGQRRHARSPAGSVPRAGTSTRSSATR